MLLLSSSIHRRIWPGLCFVEAPCSMMVLVCGGCVGGVWGLGLDFLTGCVGLALPLVSFGAFVGGAALPLPLASLGCGVIVGNVIVAASAYVRGGGGALVSVDASV